MKSLSLKSKIISLFVLSLLITIVTAYVSVKTVIGDYINVSYEQRMLKNVSLISSEIQQSLARDISVIESLDFGIIGIRDTKQKLGYEQVVKLINKKALSDKGSMKPEQAQYYIDLAKDHPEGIKVTQTRSAEGGAQVIISKYKSGVVDFFTIDLSLIGELIERYSIPGVYFEVLDQQGQPIYSTVKVNLEAKQTDAITVANSSWYLHSYIDRAYTDGIISGINQDITRYLALCALVMLLFSLFSLKAQFAPLLKLQHLMESLSGKNADLTQRIVLNRRDEVGQISHSINQFIDNLQSLFRNISSSSLSLNQQRDELDNQNASNVAVVSQYERQSQVLSEAIEQIRQSSLAIQSQTSDANHLAEQIVETVSQTVEKGESAEHSVNQLVDKTQQVSSSMEVMDTASQGISGILDTIQKIADQTNLLALNASIEAARAGDSGRGFAVVADEVRSLASKTHSCTAQIDQLLQQFSGSSKQIDNLMQDALVSSELSKQTTQEVMSQIQLVKGSVEQINQINHRVAQSADQQCSMMEVLNEELSQANQMTQQIAACATVISNINSKMQVASEELSSRVLEFKV
ncbi:methyl-accepting chemotaxis protein [Agarivorans sp.]|uniref:methyl-accepting chemotaxis protein n=1 Tax=Agarivorans sp. TaxID=1872412 RepID=UPI003CFBC9CF